MSAEETLTRLGFDVLDAPTPSAPGLRVSPAEGVLLHVAGQVPTRAGALVATGLVGADVDLPTARECARQAAANALAQLHRTYGSLDYIRAVALRVYIATAAGFAAHSEVASGASDLLIGVLGERGHHSRCAIGVASLPRSSPVEIELVAGVVALP